MERLKALFEKLKVGFTHHADTGAMHGDSTVVIDMLGGMIEHVEDLGKKVESSTNEALHSAIDDLRDQVEKLRADLAATIAGSAAKSDKGAPKKVDPDADAKG